MTLLTIKEVARELRVSPQTVYRLMKAGDFQVPVFRIGKHGVFRISSDDLERFITEEKKRCAH